MAITKTLGERFALSQSSAFIDKVRVQLVYEAWYQRSTSADPGVKLLAWRVLNDPSGYAKLFAEAIMTQEAIANTAPDGFPTELQIQSAVGGIFPQFVQPT